MATKHPVPSGFKCMGHDVKVIIKEFVSSEDDHGYFDHESQSIFLNELSPKDSMGATFWHEVVHCLLMNLSYTELNQDEAFVDRLGQLLYQMEKTQKPRS